MDKSSLGEYLCLCVVSLFLISFHALIIISIRALFNHLIVNNL